MSARQPFRPTPRPDSQLPSSHSDSLKTFHSQRTDADLDNSANKSFNFSGLFNPKKRDQSLPTRKSKSREDHQAPPQNVSDNSWSTGSHPAKLDPSRAPSPVLSSTTSGLGNAPTYQNSGMSSIQAEDIPSSPIADSRSPTGSFFAQEANSQHLLPMINEIDEDTEPVDAHTARSTSLFFTGRYTDSSLPRKRAQRTEDNAGVDGLESVDAKRFKPEQVRSWLSPSTRRLAMTTFAQGAGLHKQITPILLHSCCVGGAIQDETTWVRCLIGARFRRIRQREFEQVRGSEEKMGRLVHGGMECWCTR